VQLNRKSSSATEKSTSEPASMYECCRYKSMQPLTIVIETTYKSIQIVYITLCVSPLSPLMASGSSVYCQSYQTQTDCLSTVVVYERRLKQRQRLPKPLEQLVRNTKLPILQHCCMSLSLASLQNRTSHQHHHKSDTRYNSRLQSCIASSCWFVSKLAPSYYFHACFITGLSKRKTQYKL
jgi:hypothetical protein